MAQAPDSPLGGDVIYTNPNPFVRPGSNVVAMSDKPGDVKDPNWMDTFLTEEGGVKPLGVLVGVGIVLWLLL